MKGIKTVYFDHKDGVAIITYNFELLTREIVLNNIFHDNQQFYSKEDLEWDCNKRTHKNTKRL